MNKVQAATAILHGIGAPINQRTLGAMLGWFSAEGGHWNNSAHYNPLNTTQTAPGATGINSVGVKAYTSWQEGINATIQTLKNGHYGNIIAAFHNSDPNGVARAIGASPWGTSGSLVAHAIADSTGVHYHLPSDTGASMVSVAQGHMEPTTSTHFTGGQTDIHQAITDSLLRGADQPIDTSGAFHASSFLKNAASAVASGQYTTPSVAQTVMGSKATGSLANVAKAKSGAMPKGVANFEGKRVAAWIAPILQYARQHGWKGSVTSGYRSFAQQKAIYDSGVRPAAVPGTSNHEGTDFPRGAVDVSDAAQLSAILMRSPYAKTLLYAGAKDPVHFSHPHNGGY